MDRRLVQEERNLPLLLFLRYAVLVDGSPVGMSSLFQAMVITTHVAVAGVVSSAKKQPYRELGGVRSQLPLKVRSSHRNQPDITELVASVHSRAMIAPNLSVYFFSTISSGDIPLLFSARTTSGTLVEPWWNPGGTLVKPPWWNSGRTLVEPSWNLT